MKKRILTLLITITAFLSCGNISAKDFSDNPEMVKIAQQELENAGFPCGTPDGNMGNQTVEAIESYYKSQNVIGAPTVDLTLLLSLGVETTIPILEDYDFKVCTLEERQEIASMWDVLKQKINDAAHTIGVKNGLICSLGNYSENPNSYTVDACYTADDEKWLLINCLCSEAAEYCEVGFIRDIDSGDYYYLGPAYDGDYDISEYVIE